MFTKLDTDYAETIKTNLSKYNLNDLISENMYISGSFVLQLIQNKTVNTSDLDLYLNIYKMSKYEIENIVIQIVNAGYYLKNTKFDTLGSDDCKIQGKNILKSKVIYNMTQKILRSRKLNDYQREYSYFSLAKHIINILRLYNPEIDKEIDLMILKPKKKNTIQNLLLETFDYDIVKNYIDYKEGNYNVYVCNLENIINKKAVMTISHFKDRILNNIHEFDNFITRYVKYKEIKKFNIYIDNMKITVDHFKKMVEIYIKRIDFCYNYIEKNNKIYNVTKITMNNKNANISKLFKIKMESVDGIENRYDYNLRKYIMESTTADYFT